MGSKHVALDLQDVPFSSPLDTINKIPRLVSPKVGLMKSLHHGYYRAQDPVTLSIGCGSADLSRVSDVVNSPKAGGGGDRVEVALAATIGEMVERYCMYWFDRKSLVTGTYRELEKDAISPHALRLYSEEQVRNKPPEVNLDYFTENVNISWVWAYSLTRRRPVLVPATLVYLGYEEVEGEKVIGRNASSGLAAGATLEEAILSGLNEVIERDAFTISWMRRRVGPLIKVDDDELAESIRKRYMTDHPEVNLRFHDISLDIRTTCVLGLLRRPAEFGPALSVSSVSRTSPRDAIGKCMREIGQGFPYIRYLRDQLKDWEMAPDFTDLTTFDHHYTMYNRRPDLVTRNLSFCDAVTDEVLMSELPDPSTGRPLGDIDVLTQMLDELGHEVIVVDITTPDVKEVGLHVVRVLAPGLMPIHGSHNFPYLGVQRLYDVPEKLGWAETEGWDPNQGINKDPHPFP